MTISDLHWNWQQNLNCILNRLQYFSFSSHNQYLYNQDLTGFIFGKEWKLLETKLFLEGFLLMELKLLLRERELKKKQFTISADSMLNVQKDKNSWLAYYFYCNLKLTSKFCASTNISIITLYGNKFDVIVWSNFAQNKIHCEWMYI